MFIYASIFAQPKLNNVFEAYKCRYHEEMGKVNQKDYQVSQGNQSYAVMLFEHLRSNIDLSKVNMQNLKRTAI